MFACLYNPSASNCLEALRKVSHQFSHEVEAASEDTVLFDITPLRRMLGPPHQIASEICRCGYEQDLDANLAIAGNPDSAILLARNRAGVTLATSGQERFELAKLPLSSLGPYISLENTKLWISLQKWGLQTCGDFAALSPKDISERLGPEGLYLHRLACGEVQRPLHIPPSSTSYEERMDLEHPLAVLEPLLFLLGSALRDLCNKLRAQSMGARLLKLDLQLEESKEYRCSLEFPIPTSDTRTLLKLLQLHMERHAPEAAVLAFHLILEPARPKRAQKDFFSPAVPLPDQLELTMARLRGLVGPANISTPSLLNTRHPDAIGETDLNSEAESRPSPIAPEEEPGILRLAMRLFRPALPARVQVMKFSPRLVKASRVQGAVLQAAGPWKTSGEWWTATRWEREEWDVALDDGGLYRIYQEAASETWFVQGVYD